ncbi:MAG: hypothetical protein RLZZ01_1594 [Actinomycetota bacterium]
MRQLPDISIRQLEYLVAVADHPTWAVAAESVGVSASALSQGLAELERRLGVDLFERDGRRRSIRPSVGPVLDHARQVLALTGDLAGWAARIRTAASGSVRVGMIDVAAVIHFPAALAAFRREHPDVELVLTVAPSAALLEQLRNGQLDLVVCVRPTSLPPGLVDEVLLVEPLVVYAPDGVVIGHPANWGPWVLFPEDSHTRREVEAGLTAMGATVRITAESHQPDVLGQMVRLGLGWTVLPVVQDPGGVTVGPRVAVRQLVLVRRSGAVVDPAADALATSLRSRSTSDVRHTKGI